MLAALGRQRFSRRIPSAKKPISPVSIQRVVTPFRVCVGFGALLVLLLMAAEISQLQTVSDSHNSAQNTRVTEDTFGITPASDHSKSAKKVETTDNFWQEIQSSYLSGSNGGECEKLFADNFKQDVVQCSAGNSRLVCRKNAFSQAMFCELDNLIIDPRLLSMSRGGEDLQAVSGRNEDDEYPQYGGGSLTLGCLPQGRIPSRPVSSFYQYDVLTHIRESFDAERHKELFESHCSDAPNDEVFILTTRYEYANLYHTATDWFNVFQTAAIAGSDPRTTAVHLLFLDGHAKGTLDSAWRMAFGGQTYYVKHLDVNGFGQRTQFGSLHERVSRNGGVVCMRKAWLSPPGYIGGLALKSMTRQCLTHQSTMVKAFNRWFVDGVFQALVRDQTQDEVFVHFSAHLVAALYKETLTSMTDFHSAVSAAAQSRRRSPNGRDLRVAVICRKDYMAHPRNKQRQTKRKFKSDSGVLATVRRALDSHTSVELIYLEDLHFGLQIVAVSQLDVVIGVHGAGLTHVLFLPPQSSVIEIVPSGFDARIHFKYLSAWSGHHYATVAANGGDATPVVPDSAKLLTAVQNAVSHLISQ